MGEEVNIIIDNLCTKLGTTVQTLVPEMAKMNISENIVIIIICTIVAIVIYKIFKKVWKIYKEDYHSNNEYYIFLIICTIVIESIIVIIAGFSVTSLAGWIASPTAKTIETIIAMIG